MPGLYDENLALFRLKITILNLKLEVSLKLYLIIFLLWNCQVCCCCCCCFSDSCLCVWGDVRKHWWACPQIFSVLNKILKLKQKRGTWPRERLRHWTVNPRVPEYRVVSHQTVSRLLSSPNKQSGKYNENDPILIGTAVSGVSYTDFIALVPTWIQSTVSI